MNQLMPILTRYLSQSREFVALPKKKQPPLPMELKNQLITEFRVFEKIPHYMTSKIMEQINKINQLCNGYDSPYPEILEQIENATYSRNPEKANSLIQTVIHH